MDKEKMKAVYLVVTGLIAGIVVSNIYSNLSTNYKVKKLIGDYEKSLES